jgi:anti-anti-sigma factor
VSIARGAVSGSVVLNLHGTLDEETDVHLQQVCSDILEDRDIVAITANLYGVEGVDITAISLLAAGAAKRHIQLTLIDPSELLAQVLDEAHLTGLIRMLQQDRRPVWQVSDRVRREGRRRHPSNHGQASAQP